MCPHYIRPYKHIRLKYTSINMGFGGKIHNKINTGVENNVHCINVGYIGFDKFVTR